MIKKLLKTISDGLTANGKTITEADVAQAIGLSQDATTKQFQEKLGIYQIFESKDDYTNVIKTEVKNKEKEISAKTSELETTKKTFNEKIVKLVSPEWKKLGFEKEMPQNIDLDNFDYDNVNKSLLQIAEKNNIGKPQNGSEYNKNSETRGDCYKVIGGMVFPTEPNLEKK